MRRWLRRVRARLRAVTESDKDFIEAAYIEILGRPADEDGLRHYRDVLRSGVGRTSVLLSLLRSPESVARVLAASASAGTAGAVGAGQLEPLPDLTVLRRSQFTRTRDRSNGQEITIFTAESIADFDWLEEQIIEHGYYEREGVWTLTIDSDKRLVAEMMRSFQPEKALELGCAAGAVLACLDDVGIRAEGVEISAMAVSRAPESIRNNIHKGDLLSLQLPGVYDLVFGLDIFEHLNPNKLDSYIQRVVALVAEGGFVFCNIPMFGTDPVFGTIFPFYVEGWADDAAGGRHFSRIHTDERGYPIHGHLTWADAQWWCRAFEGAGLSREVAIERAFHHKYDRHMKKRSPARMTYFVFSKTASQASRDSVLRAVEGERSDVLGSSN